ncbi:MAG: 2OG-Fe(II) oxygenase family protein, partial [Pseudomonadota bacterium]
EAKDTSGTWHAVPCDPGMMVINAGDMLEMATGGYYPATVHRVVNPPVTGTPKPRFSSPMFLHPRPEVVLKPGTTADDFLNQRLREIGLKG